MKKDFQEVINNSKKTKAIAEGSHEWLQERVYGVFSIILLFWFMFNSALVYKGYYLGFDDFISKPINSALFIMFIGVFLYHLSLAVKVVLEDYVACKCLRFAMIITTKFVGIFAFIVAVISTIRIVIG